MPLRLKFGLALAVALACPLAPHGAPTDDTNLTADEIVARYMAARGGYERLKAIRTVVYRGTYREPGSDPLPGAAMALMRPFYKLVGDPERLSSEFREGYDGSAWEFYGDPGIVLRTVGAASAAARHQAYVDGPLVDYRAKGSTVTLIGKVAVGVRPAYQLRVQMRDGFEEDELIDAETWLLVASRKSAPIHAFGKSVESETRFGDYRPFGGVMFSTTSREVEIGTERVLNEMTWTSITVNAPLATSVFSPPEILRTPLQRLLQQLYDERTDSTAVLWSYADFRRAFPEVATDEGMQVVGYQMLKMGDTASAVALLEANAADFPRSSGAAFALGRAYQSVGDAARARSEFRRALTLDPKNGRAERALAAMGAPGT